MIKCMRFQRFVWRVTHSNSTLPSSGHITKLRSVNLFNISKHFFFLLHSVVIWEQNNDGGETFEGSGDGMFQEVLDMRRTEHFKGPVCGI